MVLSITLLRDYQETTKTSTEVLAPFFALIFQQVASDFVRSISLSGNAKRATFFNPSG